MKLICFVFTLLFSVHAIAQDPFKPYLTGKPPVIVKELGEEIRGNVKVRKLVFHSRDVQTPRGAIPTNIFAAIVRPLQPGKYPGLLIFHGGGGNAEMDKALAWAKLGYITAVLDEPGIGNSDKMSEHSTGLWKTYKYGTNRFTDVPQSTIFDGVLASLQMLYLLNAQPDVIKDRIGIAGISWGGYMTTMITGLAGKYVHASFSVYGCGYYDEGSTFQKGLDTMATAKKAAWLRYLDAGRRAQNIRTPFFIAGAANDAFFYPPAVMQTLRVLKSKDVNHLFGPNGSHKIMLPGGTTKKDTTRPGWLEMEQAYFDYHLKGIGQPLPVVTASEQVNATQLRFKVKSTTPITEAIIYYSYADTTWPQRVWVPVTAALAGDGWYKATLPEETKDRQLDWYANVSDARPVSASGYIIRSH